MLYKTIKDKCGKNFAWIVLAMMCSAISVFFYILFRIWCYFYVNCDPLLLYYE